MRGAGLALNCTRSLGSTDCITSGGSVKTIKAEEFEESVTEGRGVGMVL